MRSSNSPLSYAAAAALFSGAANAFWRMECTSRSGLARIDPVVDFGRVSDHAHAIHGGSNFGVSATYQDLVKSECTSCLVKQDNSVYWTPSLHFQYPNGTTVVVPQVGGMLAYYLLFGENIQAFPEGFKMLAGDTRQRNFTLPVPDPPKSEWTGDQATQAALAQKSLGFNCLDYSKNPEGTLYRHFLPDKAYLDANCPDGLRLELMFPSCWNGKDIDSSDHKSHVAYSSLVIDGNCPSGFETRIPSLLYETIWNTNAFKGQDGQFVLANGDPTGYGYHADFMNGWDVGFLQSAIKTCTNPSGSIYDCPLFSFQTEAEAAQCKIENLSAALVDDNCAGPGPGLPGNVQVQYGPGYAAPHGHDEEAPASSVVPPVPSVSEVPSAPVPTLSYSEGTKAVTDNAGGVITIAKANVTPNVAPVPTVPAVMAEGAGQYTGPGRKISTSTYTSAGVVYEVLIVEVDVTVTADGPAPTVVKKKRHVHRRHNRAHL